jgi:hypothetical protein
VGLAGGGAGPVWPRPPQAGGGVSRCCRCRCRCRSGPHLQRRQYLLLSTKLTWRFAAVCSLHCAVSPLQLSLLWFRPVPALLVP